METKDLKTLFTEIIDYDQKMKQGEILADQMITWRLLYVFINRFQYISNLNRKLQHLKLVKQINSIAKMRKDGQLDD